MKRLRTIILLVALVGAIHSSSAGEVNLVSNAPGSTIPGQSFNETRAIDITLLSGGDQLVTSMTLDGLSIGGASSALVGARIYDTNTLALLATADTTVTASGTVTIPISALLNAGADYRVGVYIETTPLFQATGTFINNSGGFPYTETSGLFQINSAHSVGADSFPGGNNIFVPQISLRVLPTSSDLSANAPGSLISGQSFNETRAVDVTVLSSTDLKLSSMNLAGLSIGGASSALVGARIYETATQLLVASADTTITITPSGPVTVPISAILEAGVDYRISFYVETAPLFQASGTFISNAGGFSYNGSGGLLRINSAHAIGSDSFPANPNNAVPQMALHLRPLAFDLSANAPGATISGQSFNETRGLDVTVLSEVDLEVSSISLAGLSIGGATSALVGARIYDGGTLQLVASADTTITASGPVTIPISALLEAGADYRVGFYVETTPLFQATGTFISNAGGFPYLDPRCLFQINSAHAIGSDSFPANPNNAVPHISIQATAPNQLDTIIEAGMLKLSWKTIPGDQYSIEESSNLSSFSTLSSPGLFTATSGKSESMIPMVGLSKYYRIRRH